jgi:hypothetical protein
MAYHLFVISGSMALKVPLLCLKASMICCISGFICLDTCLRGKDEKRPQSISDALQN